jgi:hypothetical protein
MGQNYKLTPAVSPPAWSESVKVFIKCQLCSVPCRAVLYFLSYSLNQRAVAMRMRLHVTWYGAECANRNGQENQKGLELYWR